MSIERDYDNRVIECDAPRCSTTTDDWHKEDFREMIADAQTRGWHVINRNGVWKHFCPEHAAAERLKDQRTRMGAGIVDNGEGQDRAEAQAKAYLRS